MQKTSSGQLTNRDLPVTAVCVCVSVSVVCMSVAMRSRGSETDYMHESKPISGDQTAQQQCLMSSVYLPTNNYLYHKTDVDQDRPVGWDRHWQLLFNGSAQQKLNLTWSVCVSVYLSMSLYLSLPLTHTVTQWRRNRGVRGSDGGHDPQCQRWGSRLYRWPTIISDRS